MPPAPPARHARKILDEKGIAAGDVAGSGRGGRVTKEDAVAAQPKAAAAAAPAVIAAVGDRPEERVPMTRLRARIAERLLQSKNENAILTTFNEVNMAPVMALRKQYGEKFEKAHGVRLGFMGFFVKAAVAALKKFPILNASVDGNDIVYHGYIDIGIAVGSPRGLVVPILRNAESMSIADIELKIAEFGEKAKAASCRWRAVRRHLLDLQRRRVRLDDVDPDHQPAAVGHPRHPRHQGPPGGRERPDRRSVRSTTWPCPTTTASSTVARRCSAW